YSRQPSCRDAADRWQILLEQLPGAATIGAGGEPPARATGEGRIDMIPNRRNHCYRAAPPAVKRRCCPACAGLVATHDPAVRVGQKTRLLAGQVSQGQIAFWRTIV